MGDTPKPQTKKNKPEKRHYTPEEKKVVLACLEANGGNLSKTARECGVARSTLIEWRDHPTGDATPDPAEIDTLKKEIQGSFVDKIKQTRERLLDRIYEVSKTEQDLFKLSGAFKTVMEAASEEEVNSAIAARIKTAQTQAAQGTADPRSTGGTGLPTTN
jgi:transposase-like protein